MSAEQSCEFEIFLPKSRSKVFAMLVDQPETWWQPLGRERDPEAVAITPHAGGMCEETGNDGSRQIWGTVLSIEPPLFLRLAWQQTPDGHAIMDPAAASRVVITLREAGEGTRLEVVHSDFIRHGDTAGACRDLMCSADGWPRLLARMAEAAKRL